MRLLVCGIYFLEIYITFWGLAASIISFRFIMIVATTLVTLTVFMLFSCKYKFITFSTLSFLFSFFSIYPVLTVYYQQAKERICKLIQSGADNGARVLLDGRDIVVILVQLFPCLQFSPGSYAAMHNSAKLC
jgi:hypothetical protein